MRHTILIIFLLLVANPLNLSAQTTADSTRVFEEATYLAWVKKYHPVIQQSNLLDLKSDAYQLKARGGFEPKVEGGIERKSFDGKTYYTLGKSGLKIPSWFGMTFKGGYNWTNGVFLNPENNLPDAGQAYAGIEWAVGQGLLLDERRAALEKAKILQKANKIEQQLIINDLLLDAGKAYWEWVKAYNDWQIQQEGLRLAQIRFEGTKQSFLQGDKPAIDTLESLIQLQNRSIAIHTAKVNYDNTSQILSNFLWYENEIPVEISDLLSPPNYTTLDTEALLPNVKELLVSLDNQHPIILQYGFKLEQLEVDRRLRKEQLKPTVNLAFNFLGNGFDFVNTPKDSEIGNLNAILTENYKAGISVATPVLRRKARADVELAELKLLDTKYQLRQKKQELSNKIINYEAQVVNSRQLIDFYRASVKNYQLLLQAENEKYRIGESSIFLINSREQKLIEAQLKLVKQLSHYYKNRLGLLWAAGLLE